MFYDRPPFSLPFLEENTFRKCKREYFQFIKMLVFLFLLMTPDTLFSQEILNIDEIGWSISIPPKYHLTPLNLPSKSPSVKNYRYRRESLLNKDNIPVYPNIIIITEYVPEESEPVLYSINVRMRFRTKINILKYFVPEDSLFSVNAIGHLLEYTEKFKGQDMTHKVYMLNSTKGTKGITIIMDCTKPLFPKVEKEFLDAMKSIRENN